MKTKWAYILIGNDKTGKTNFQRILYSNLCLDKKERLDCNLDYKIKHLDKKEYYDRVSFMNRSFQEKSEYEKNVDVFFASFFNDKSISILSSHLDCQTIAKMIIECKKRFFNVCGVFFSNSINLNPNLNAEISELEFNFRIIIDNPINDNWLSNLQTEGKLFSDYIVTK